MMSIHNLSSPGSDKSSALFERAVYPETEDDRARSLSLLANCVNITNSTILRERRLLPDRFFIPFRVYKKVNGYILDQSSEETRKVLIKMKAVDNGIRRQTIKKLAIVVENELDPNPEEAFIWTFQYDRHSLVTAEIGYGGSSSIFSVHYKDMYSTEQQFCKLFKNLQNILNNLGPVPMGLMPSLKIAYNGEPDPDLVKVFSPMDKFIDMRMIGVGATAFPHEQKFQLQYASNFHRDVTLNQTPLPTRDSVFAADDVEFEAVRVNRTMELSEGEEMRDLTNPVERPTNPIPTEVDVSSIVCNIGSKTNHIPPSPEPRRVSEEKTSSKKRRSGNISEKKRKPERSAPPKKKVARRLISEDVEEIVEKRAAVSEDSILEEPREKEPVFDDVANLSDELSSPPRYARTSTSAIQESPTSQNESSEVVETRKSFGRTDGFKKIIEMSQETPKRFGKSFEIQ